MIPGNGKGKGKTEQDDYGSRPIKLSRKVKHLIFIVFYIGVFAA